MINNVPRPCVDEPLVAQRVIFSPHTWGFIQKSKLVVQRVQEIDKKIEPCYTPIKPRNLTRRQAKRGSSERQEVCSVLYGILTDEELTEIVVDAAHAAGFENPERLRQEFRLRVIEKRLLDQYGDLDNWDLDSS